MVHKVRGGGGGFKVLKGANKKAGRQSHTLQELGPYLPSSRHRLLPWQQCQVPH